MLLIHETVSVPMVLERLIPQKTKTDIGAINHSGRSLLRYMGLWLLPLKQTIYHHVPDSPFLYQRRPRIVGWAAVIRMWHSR